MDRALEERYLQLAAERPDLTCAEAPLEVLTEAASDGEPTDFLVEFFSTGYAAWLTRKHGRQVNLSREQVNNAVVVLWLRACRLHTSILLGQQDPERDRPFFSDEGLYGPDER